MIWLLFYLDAILNYLQFEKEQADKKNAKGVKSFLSSVLSFVRVQECSSESWPVLIQALEGRGWLWHKPLSYEPLCLEVNNNFPLFGGLGKGRVGWGFFFFELSHLNENILVTLQLPIVPLVVSDYRSIFNKENKTFTSGEPWVLTISW